MLVVNAYKYLPSFGTVLRPGKRGCFEYVHFFLYGGILSLPYQFCHHAHKMLCDRRNIFSENLFDTDQAVRATSECSCGSPRCATLCHIIYSVNPSATVSLYGSMSVCPCRRRRLVKVGLGRVKLRKALVDFGNVLCYYIVRVYQDLPYGVTIPKAPSDLAACAKNPYQSLPYPIVAPPRPLCAFTKHYHLTRPNQTHQWSCMCRRLPILTTRQREPDPSHTLRPEWHNVADRSCSATDPHRGHPLDHMTHIGPIL